LTGYNTVLPRHLNYFDFGAVANTLKIKKKSKNIAKF